MARIGYYEVLAPRDSSLTSVDALSSTNAWAVGFVSTATSRKSLIQRWDGTSWTIASSPNPGTLGNSLLGVAAVGPDNVWAAGWPSTRVRKTRPTRRP